MGWLEKGFWAEDRVGVGRHGLGGCAHAGWEGVTWGVGVEAARREARARLGRQRSHSRGRGSPRRGSGGVEGWSRVPKEEMALSSPSRAGREGTGSCLSRFQTVSVLKGRLSDLQWSVMNQEMQVKRLESERQELKEQLELQHR